MVRCFNTLTAAKAYYSSLRKAIEIGDKPTESDRFGVLYHRYCEITNWDGEVKDGGDVVAAWDNKPRGPSQYAQTKASAVIPPSGDPSIFGIGEALAKIAV